MEKEKIKLSENLFWYRDGKSNYIINFDRILVKFNNGVPYFIDGNLVIVSDEINIYHDLLGDNNKTSIIKKEGIVCSTPFLYNENILFILKKGIVLFDTNLNLIRCYEYDFDDIVSNERIEDDKLLFDYNGSNYSYDIINNNLIKIKRSL